MNLVFFSYNRTDRTDEKELVLEALAQGKVVLNRQNIADSSRAQLWRLTADGYLENVGFNQRQMANRSTNSSSSNRSPPSPYVLDVLDAHSDRYGYPLMLKSKSNDRNRFQIWTFTIVSRLD